ncbi:hypothetical protein MLD38_025949 [Melastoma candidum]|uniref:Uncharacterized protein n=1 Tax=Melastoma candidum TaxID=119954 RepID=A0ACB9P069_9MYRT|nr:hypothetical protein MLD38_025949 [Melastoma candidum]
MEGNGAVQTAVGSVDLKGKIWGESKIVWSIILPTVVARVTSYSTSLVTQVWIGHINKVELAAFGLIMSVLVLFTNGIILGMSSATETFCGQAFGAKQNNMMGIYLQRSWIVNVATVTILLSVSSGVMLCLELWYQAILVLLAGYLDDATVEISAFSFCMTINSLEFMICLSFLSAACIRVANELGRGNEEAAMFSVKVILTNSLIIGILFSILFLVFGKDIPRLLTSDIEVQEAMADLSYLLSISFLFNSIQPVFTGVAVGSGLQGRVAIINICCYYLVGLPVGLLLGFLANWGIKGLWIGLLLGIAVQTMVLGLMIWRTNWQEQVDKVSNRLNQWLLEPSTENDEASVPSS